MKYKEIMLQERKLQQFFWWMNERHSIYLKRKRGEPWPWTTDPILQAFKFTNVYRELDTGTAWLREHIIEPAEKNGWDNLFFNIATYRRYNYSPTAELLGYLGSDEVNESEECDYNILKDFIVRQLLYKLHDGIKVFTSAHMLCGNIKGDDGIMPPTKVEQVFGISFSKLWNIRHSLEPVKGDTLESAFNRLMVSGVPGYGRFIWYEVITDLRHTHYLNGASDIMTWANPGPGARRGIMRLMNLDVRFESEFAPDNNGLVNSMFVLLQISPEFLDKWMDPLEMRDVEHSLCEWDKYQRVLNGEGRPRQKFVPPHLRQV